MTLPKIKIETKNIIDAENALEHLIKTEITYATNRLLAAKSYMSTFSEYERRRGALNEAITHIDQAILYFDQKQNLKPEK